jgi:hypothetical protein
MKIITHYDPKPIPCRWFDWTAIDDDTYGGDTNDPIGYGATERQAIDDLKEMIEERTQAA